ncbi:hypothetical protein THRCLA_20562, partial [Thraustotheca clavata]
MKTDETKSDICLMASTLFQYGHELKVLAWNHSDAFFDGTSCGEPCEPNLDNNYRLGQQKKLYWLLHYVLHSPDLHDDDLILFNDAWDVIVQDDPIHLPQIFLNHTNGTRGIIFNSEPSCGDSFNRKDEYGEEVRKLHFPVHLNNAHIRHNISGNHVCDMIAAKTALNTHLRGPNWSLGSGGFLGDVLSARAFLSKVYSLVIEHERQVQANDVIPFDGDQIFFHLAYIDSPEINVKVDANSQIFLVLSYLISDGDLQHFYQDTGCSYEYMLDNKPSNLSWLGAPPLFLHFPGEFKHYFSMCKGFAARYRKKLSPGKYLIDIDRGNTHMAHFTTVHMNERLTSTKAIFAVLVLMSLFMLSNVTLLSQPQLPHQVIESNDDTQHLRHKPHFRPRKLRFLTLADLPKPQICVMASALYEQGYPLDVLAWNNSEKFFDGTSCGDPCTPNTDNNFRHGQQKKLYWLVHYFQNHPDLHDDDLVLYNDAWDVIVQDDISRLPDLFLKHTNGKRGVIFNSEPACGDSFAAKDEYAKILRETEFEVRLDTTYPPRKVFGESICNLIAAKTALNTKVAGPNWSLGSGGILGDVRSIRAFLARVEQVRQEHEDLVASGTSVSFQGDQIAFQLAYVRFPEINAKVDASGEIFLVLSYLVAQGDLEYFDPNDGCTSGFLHNNKPSTLTWFQGTPVFIHFPGDYKKLFGSCEELAAVSVRAVSPGKYFNDIDRTSKVAIHDVCPNFKSHFHISLHMTEKRASFTNWLMASRWFLGCLVLGTLWIMILDWRAADAAAKASITFRDRQKEVLNVISVRSNHSTGSFVPGKLRILTLADDPKGTICSLAASIYQQGHVLEVMAWNYSDTFFDGTTCGTRCRTPEGGGNFRFGQEKKLFWLENYFEKKPDLHDNDLVLFTDAWDVIVNGDTSMLPELFLRQTNHERGVIFNGEPSCGDSFTLPTEYGDKLRDRNWRIQLDVNMAPRNVTGRYMCNAIAAKTLSTSFVQGPNWSLGSGGILGDVKSIREFLRRVHQVRSEQEKEYKADPEHSFLFEGDQILFQLAYLQYPEINAKVDASGEIFFVLSSLIAPGDFNEFSPHSGCTSNYMAHGIPSRFAWNQVAPVFFHFPGDFKAMYGSCADPTGNYRQRQGEGQFFLDI